MGRLIREENLDPTLIAKIATGSESGGVDINSVLTNYMKKTDKVEITQLGTTSKQYMDAINTNLNTKLTTYYKKGEPINATDLPLNFTNRVTKLEGTVTNLSSEYTALSTGLNSQIALGVNDYLNKTNIATTLQTNTEKKVMATVNTTLLSYDSKILNLQNATTTNTTDIAYVKNQLPLYRKLSVPIAVTDCDSTITEKFATMQTSIDNLKLQKLDKISNSVLGGLMYVANESGSVGIGAMVIPGNYVYSNSELQYATANYYPDIYDLQNNKKYVFKLKTWNYASTRKTANEGILNNTVDSTKYKRVSIADTNYKVPSTSYFTTTSDSYYSINVNQANDKCIYTIGFYGTAFKLNGKIQTTKNTSDIYAIIDGVNSYKLNNVGNTALDAACLLNIENLSLGRHTISVCVYTGATILLNQYIDIDSTSSALLLKADILDSELFSAYVFDQQDNFPNMPTTYGVTKPTTFIDISKLTVSDIYTITDSNLYLSGAYVNKLLYSNVLGSMYSIYNGSVTIIQQNERLTLVVDANGTASLQANNILMRNHAIYIYDDTTKTYRNYTDTELTVTYTLSSILFTNKTNAVIKLLVCIL